METGYLRLRALPFGQDVADFIDDYESVFVVEANNDGQLCSILRSELPAHATKLHSVTKCDGWAISARFITESILNELA